MPDAAAGAVDEDTLAGVHAALVADALQRSHARDRQRGRLLEAEARRLQGDVRWERTHVLAERAAPGAEDLVAGSEARHVVGDRLNDAGEVDAAPGLLRPPESKERPHGERTPADLVRVEHVDGCRPHAYEHAPGLELRLVDLRELQLAVLVADDRLHDILRGGVHCKSILDVQRK